MKRIAKLVLCLLLAACMLLQTVAASGANTAARTTPPPTEETEPEVTQPEATEPEVTEPEVTEPEVTEPEATQPEVTEPEEPDPLEGYTFPENWAKEPLMFAVRNGILKGRQNNDLDPTGKTTRAEMAAMLVRLLGARGSVSLSGYKDVRSTAWYYQELSAAVELGIFNGISDSTMAPDRHITRQETFTVLARAFGLEPQNPNAYQTFTDGEKVSAYARGPVSALVELEVASGYPNGSLMPTASITRQEVAALFYKLLDTICDEPREIPAQGFALYRGTEPPNGVALDGTLILGASLSGDVTIEDLAVNGTLILRCATGTNLTLGNLAASTVSQVSPMTTAGTGTIGTLRVTGSGSSGLNAEILMAAAPGTFSGAYETAVVSGDGTVFPGNLENLILERGSAQVDGTAHCALLTGDDTVLTGSGYAETVTVRGRRCTVTLACGQLVDEVDWGLDGVQVKVTGTDTVSVKSPKLELTATFTGFQAGHGTDGTGRLCRLEWYQGTTLVASQDDFLLREGATATFTRTYNQDNYIQSTTFRVVLICGDESVSGQKTVTFDVYDWDYANARNIVETVRIAATTNQDTNLYADKNCTKVLRSLPKNTSMTHLYYSNEWNAPGKVELSDGTVGWVNWLHYNVSRENYTTTQDYSLGVKEGFVNLSGYSSPTRYLIWLNLKTQQVNIFEGSKGSWKLTRSYDCSTGTNLTPTVSGVYSVIYKTDLWRFDETINDVLHKNFFYTHSVTGFWGGQAFHSMPYKTEDDTLYIKTMGIPSSHGCVRMPDEGCEYIYEQIPYSTTVVIY